MESFSLQEMWRFARLPGSVVSFYTEVSNVVYKCTGDFIFGHDILLP